MNLLMGANGAGKSSVFDVLYRLRLLLSGGQHTVKELFPYEDFTRWNKHVAPNQQFEVVLEDKEYGTYRYKLIIEHLIKEGKNRIGFEELLHENNPLYRYEAKNEGHARLYRDDYSEGPEVLFDWSRSGIGILEERPFNTKLARFRERFQALFVIKINLPAVSAEAPQEDAMPAQDLQNFASWYRFLSLIQQNQVFTLLSVLRDIIPGFDSLSLQPAGESKLLNVHFRKEDGELVTYRFSQLSDGQKILIILYSLLHCLPGKDVILCIDEPENYLALPEVQHWLDALEEKVENGGIQALLISHHPRLINFLAENAGKWLYREGAASPTRVKSISIDEPDGLPPSKLVEMGWIIDD
ncbi:MAG: ATP-binding protein [Bacteroidales bacterium]|nr:ATP-binding protein [Bacteroidales bacterium]